MAYISRALCLVQERGSDAGTQSKERHVSEQASLQEGAELHIAQRSRLTERSNRETFIQMKFVQTRPSTGLPSSSWPIVAAYWSLSDGH